MQRIVDTAFSEPNPTRQRRTRAIVVLRDGEIIAEQYATGFDAHTRLAGWSMAKSVLNALVGILVGEERVSLQAHALLPEWQPPDPRAAIAIEDLLRMRSGLVFSEAYADFSSDVIEMLFNQPDTAGYAARHRVRPGLTGLTQVYASRDISRTSKFRIDQVYLKRASFWLDVKLILLSFWITGTGAWEKRNRRVP